MSIIVHKDGSAPTTEELSKIKISANDFGYNFTPSDLAVVAAALRKSGDNAEELFPAAFELLCSAKDFLRKPFISIATSGRALAAMLPEGASFDDTQSFNEITSPTHGVMGDCWKSAKAVGVALKRWKEKGWIVSAKDIERFDRVSKTHRTQARDLVWFAANLQREADESRRKAKEIHWSRWHLPKP